MKRSLLLITLAMIATVSFAQLTWNVKGGMTVSNYWGDDPDTDAKIGYRIGGGLEYAFTDIFSLQPSLFIASKGAKADGLKINQVYLEAPVLGAARFRFQNDMAIVVAAGGYMAYGIGGKTKWGENSENTFGDGGLDRFDLGLASGVTLEFGKFNVGMDGQMGLIEPIDGMDARNLSMTIAVGYRF
ncbi:porin family protein [Bacteroides sp. 51]|uniref:porin family protein n=1 Tax=Bacteroides sp. 51 TaxID=2302938 RepID=UPI0013D726CB|nr:porin family protein [Bacteroides sp. 51]NDV83674.1 PorT family protein [Bacteroides sp. 51]